MTVIMVGDSLTEHGEPALHGLHPGWYIDGLGGRPVKDLGPCISVGIEERGNPQDLIVALGTNDSPGWTKDDYVEALELVPAWSRVHLVTTFADADRWGQQAYDNQAENSQWMREIAEERPRTWTIPWRYYAQNKEFIGGGVRLLRDGKHATHPEGEQWWADLISDRVAEHIGEGS